MNFRCRVRMELRRQNPEMYRRLKKGRKLERFIQMKVRQVHRRLNQILRGRPQSATSTNSGGEE